MRERLKDLWSAPPIGALELTLALSIVFWGVWWLVPGHDFPTTSRPFQVLLNLASENLWAGVGLLGGVAYFLSYFLVRPILRHFALAVGAGGASFMWSYNAAAFAFNSPQTAAAPLCIALTLGSMWVLSRRISHLIAEWHLIHEDEGSD